MIESYSNYEWFLTKDFHQYSGKWLAIVDKKVVASGNDAKEVIEITKKNIQINNHLLQK